MTCLRHLALRCRDMEKSRRFYEGLGLRFIGYRPAGNALEFKAFADDAMVFAR